MKIIIAFLLAFFSIGIQAQVGVNTATPNSTLDVRGSLANKVTKITTNTTLTINHSLIICIPTTDITITLPTAIGISGRTYVIKNTTLKKVSIQTQLSQTIEGISSYDLITQNQSVEIVSDGNNWIVLNTYIP
ncbi:hypothetical protein [Chryseobacterium viscerum]|uniref:DUF2807 domain-containing protein n=1 Tax=Chryseobacterium viscerum TaxID=1037377 RepID=A0A5N4BJK0_9FLAO|nr:hypothetical protein [Chryseobacterium viscerum]KAB1228610.1 hypothetical protein F8D52_22010 [Chryseobacterium viscerum]